MGRYLVVAYAGYPPGDKFLLGHLALFVMARVNCGAEPQPLKRVAIKGGVERVLVAVPKVGGGPAGIAECMDVQAPEALCVPDQFGKYLGSLGIIYIPLLPESCHREMILYDK